MLIHLPERINIVIAIASLIFFVVSPKRRLPISQSLFWLMVLFLGIVPNMLSSKWQGASYLVAFLTTYIVSQCRITAAVIKYSS